ncbi:Gag protein [Phytophthora palmivora]|uniref:Gag protein n=1 Tax=Phytophthora palmivora TaxID=4796 RepID=A0A2P4Y209_9STRA|nr:Gag protein [Phytophthora palmivora]
MKVRREFRVRQVEPAKDGALIATERLRVACTLSNLGGRAKTWAYMREAIPPDCFTTWAQLCAQLRAAFLPANYEYRQRSRSLVCKQGKRELHEYIQGMRVLAAPLVGNPLPEHIKLTVFMDGLKVGPILHAAVPRTREHNGGGYPDHSSRGVQPQTGSYYYVGMERVQRINRCSVGSQYRAGTHETGVPSVATDVGSSGTCNVPALREVKDSSLPNLGLEGPAAEAATQVPGELGSPECGPRTLWRLSPCERGCSQNEKKQRRTARGTRECTGYGDPFRILIDSVASTNFARRQTVARNGGNFTDALRESEGVGQVSVRLADGTVVNVPEVRMDLVVKFEDFDNTESFYVLDIDKYDLIRGMPWLENHEPWIDWRGKDIGASRPGVSDIVLVSNVPTSIRDWGARYGCQDAYAPEEVLEVTDSNVDVAMILATGHETKAHCQACGIATTASPNAEIRRAVSVPGGTDQASTICPQAAEATEDSTKSVDNIGPQVGNIVPQTVEAVEEGAESVSGVGFIVPRVVEETMKKKKESAACVSSVGNVVPRGVKKTSTRAEVSFSNSRMKNEVSNSNSETPPARPVVK